MTIESNRMKERLMTDIASGSLVSRPRWKEVVPSVLIAALALVVFLLSMSVFGYLFFTLRMSGVAGLAGFGMHGIPLFLAFMPWHLLIADAIAIIALVQLSKHFSFGWRTPRVYTALLLLSAAFFGAYIVERPVNDSLYEARTELPTPLHALYADPFIPEPGSGFTHGTVLTIDEDRGEIAIIDERTGDVTEIAVPEDVMKKTTPAFTIGETIMVAGREASGTIRAFGVRKDMRGKYRELQKEKGTAHDRSGRGNR